MFALSDVFEIEDVLREFDNIDFYVSCCNLFESMGYPVLREEEHQSVSTKEFIYYRTSKPVNLNKSDLEYFENVSELNWLFDLEFPSTNKERENVKFLALKLNASLYDRNQYVCCLTESISLLFSCNIVLLVYCNNNLHFSSNCYYGNDGEKIHVVSKWFDIINLNDVVLDKFHELCLYNVANETMEDFYFDFIEKMSREYILRPYSYEYIYWETSYDSQELIVKKSDYYRIVEEYYLNLYGEDYYLGYTEYSEGFNNDEMWVFDEILKIESKKNSAVDNFNEFAEITKENQSKLAPEKFGDAVELLTWINNHIDEE